MLPQQRPGSPRPFAPPEQSAALRSPPAPSGEWPAASHPGRPWGYGTPWEQPQGETQTAASTVAAPSQQGVWRKLRSSFSEVHSPNPVLERGFGSRGSPPPTIEGEVMTLEGTLLKTALLLGVLAVSAAAGWTFADVGMELLVAVLLVTVPVLLLIVYRPHLARTLGVAYAVLQGFLVGAVSRTYEMVYGDGIALTAVGLTISITVVLLVLYASGALRASDNLKLGVVAATGGVALFYLGSFLGGLVGASVPLIHSYGAGGIFFSVAVVVLAALNLVLDFDFIEAGVERRAPRDMEWFAAFGLLVTLIWLYLEILRLLGKSRR
jgi:uncharacterized YccA/Bax inhibitor family protein